MKRLVHFALPILCLLGAVSLTSCKSVYFNTFYNAKHDFQLAEQKRKEVETPGSRLTPAVYRELYMRAIKRASAVLQLYPKSKWVDNAILLIGKAFYWREDYSEALTKFQELQQNFPKSDLIPETIYWQGLTQWAAGRIDDARVSLGKIKKENHPELFGLARLALAEMEADQGNYEAAVTAYKSLLDGPDKDHALRAKAWQGIGNSLQALGRYDEALAAYQNVLKSKPDAETNFKTRVQIGSVLESQRRLDDALKAYDEILHVKRLRIYEAETWLKEAHVYRLKGDLLVADQTYEAVIKKYPRSKYSAEAYYQKGLIAQQVDKDIDKAKDLFDKASRENRSSDAGQAALQRQHDLVSLQRYRSQADDAKDPETALPPLFNLAELYLFNLAETDSALATYRRALALADSSEFAPKALYAIGLIYADSLKDETRAHAEFQKLIDVYPNTPYANQARERLQTPRAGDAAAEAQFQAAENLKEQGAAPEDYAHQLRQIVDAYPHSMSAPKALYALAWTYENALGNLDSARACYEQVREHYPMTRFGELAVDKLKGDFLTPPAPQDTTVARDSTAAPTPAGTIIAPASADSRTVISPAPAPKASSVNTAPTPAGTTVVPASADSGAIVSPAPAPEASSVDTARKADAILPPEVIDRTLPVYPAAARGEGRPATVVVRLMVLKDGHVDKAEVVSGPDVFHQAALNAAQKYRFKPAMQGGQPCDAWTTVTVVFEPPN